MRILLINQAFYPDVAATAQHAYDLARHLVGRGHEVHVVASRSIYGSVGAALPRRETVDGIEVHRVAASLAGKGRMALRAVDYALFLVSATTKTLTLPRPDVVVTLTTPPFIGLAGLLLKATRRTPLVYWAMDLYPEVPVALGVMRPGSPLTRLLARLDRACMKRSDRVVALGRCMARRIIARGIEPDRVQRIGVWAANDPAAPDGEPAENPYRAQWGLHGKTVVMYSGNLGLAHDAQTLCEAARLLRNRDDLRFVFVGGGKRLDEVRAFAAAHALGNVRIEPYQPRERLDDLLRLADIHLISQLGAFTGLVVPSKLFGVLAAGRPAVFVGPDDAEVARVLTETGAGRVTPIGDPAALAQVIADLAANPQARQEMGEKARRAATGPHSTPSRCEAWEALLAEVAGLRPAPRLTPRAADGR